MEKSYDKYYLKKNPATNEIAGNGKKPILGECAKRDCRLEPRHVVILNRGWQNSGVYYVEVVKKAEEVPVEKKVEREDGKKSSNETDKTEFRISLEKKADELGIKYRANVGDEKLEERIANHK